MQLYSFSNHLGQTYLSQPVAQQWGDEEERKGAKKRVRSMDFLCLVYGSAVVISDVKTQM